MKKNNMLRIASVLLVAVLLSTCAISGVFAQYFRTDDISESAKVAKWGVTITPNDNNDDKDLFYKSYDLNVDDKTVAAFEAAYDVVAPGTVAAAWTPFVLGGQPEVDVQVVYTADVTLGGNWMIPDTTTTDVEDDTVFYCPLVFTVTFAGQTTTVQQTPSMTSVADFETALENAINSTKEYEENTAFADDVNVPTIAWEWAFGDHNVSDTALGDAAITAEAPSITVAIEVDITQIN